LVIIVQQHCVDGRAVAIKDVGGLACAQVPVDNLLVDWWQVKKKKKKNN
jgi:hypothetical protein